MRADTRVVPYKNNSNMDMIPIFRIPTPHDILIYLLMHMRKINKILKTLLQ